jgi:hypothetical protein
VQIRRWRSGCVFDLFGCPCHGWTNDTAQRSAAESNRNPLRGALRFQEARPRARRGVQRLEDERRSIMRSLSNSTVTGVSTPTMTLALVVRVMVIPPAGALDVRGERRPLAVGGSPCALTFASERAGISATAAPAAG